MATSPNFNKILLGATGYTGRICAEHITLNFPTSLRWAISGRFSQTLKKLAGYLKTLNPNRYPSEIIVTLIDDNSLPNLARQTKVLVNGVGPYHRYSEPILRTCAQEGTHYVDFSTETPRIAEMVAQYEDTAKKSGSIIIPAASLSSSPPDLLAWLIASKLREKNGKPTKEIVACSKLNMAGMQGTSAITALESAQHYGIGWLLSPNPYYLIPANSSSDKKKLSLVFLGYKNHEYLGALTTSLVGVSNSAIIQRSAYLDPSLYAPDFVYAEYEPTSNTFAAILAHLFIKFAVFLLGISLIRSLLRRLSYEPGTGPDWRESTKTESAIIDAIGFGGNGTKVRGKFVWKGALVHISAIAAIEAAGLLTEKATAGELKGKGGMRTPSFLGIELIERLEAHGCVFEVEVL
ncbi:hypothetical protein CC78DRAFT_608141 [Lojkania enalia]|uniref:Saccharopine dehydrogenase NADP binding domain-containing protein n=1 Tax=Lojkania enalia TaxID=147567 RepID=A0A9P4N3T7_9PLEO|nr:hypothetical protein CC78DRAFT_608141 [Didymosphaeria enalia]